MDRDPFKIGSRVRAITNGDYGKPYCEVGYVGTIVRKIDSNLSRVVFDNWSQRELEVFPTGISVYNREDVELLDTDTISISVRVETLPALPELVSDLRDFFKDTSFADPSVGIFGASPTYLELFESLLEGLENKRKELAQDEDRNSSEDHEASGQEDVQG